MDSVAAKPRPAAATVVRLRMSHGAVVQGCAVYIGRRFARGGWDLPASIWVNPYVVGTHGTRAQVIEMYRLYVLRSSHLMARLPELRGKVLGCWCKPEACHGDVLVSLLDAL